MPNLEKCVLTAVVEGKNWKQELYKFFRQYRATPHTTTNVSPSEALNDRKLKITLPEVSPAQARQLTLQETRKTMAERDAEQKSKIKAYADLKLGIKPSDIKPGDTVLVRQPKKSKTMKTMAERDAEQKSKIKAYADLKLGIKPSDIKPGDTVLVRQPKKSKLSTLLIQKLLL